MPALLVDLSLVVNYLFEYHKRIQQVFWLLYRIIIIQVMKLLE